MSQKLSLLIPFFQDILENESIFKQHKAVTYHGCCKKRNQNLHIGKQIFLLGLMKYLSVFFKLKNLTIHHLQSDRKAQEFDIAFSRHKSSIE